MKVPRSKCCGSFVRLTANTDECLMCGKDCEVEWVDISGDTEKAWLKIQKNIEKKIDELVMEKVLKEEKHGN